MNITDRKDLNTCRKQVRTLSNLNENEYVFNDKQLSISMKLGEISFFGNSINGLNVEKEAKLKRPTHWEYSTMRNMVQLTSNYNKNLFTVAQFKNKAFYNKAKLLIDAVKKRKAKQESSPTVVILRTQLNTSQIGNFPRKFRMKQDLSFSNVSTLFSEGNSIKLQFAFAKAKQFKSTYINDNDHYLIHATFNYARRMNKMIQQKGIEKEDKVIYLIPKKNVNKTNFHDFNFNQPTLKEYFEHVAVYSWEAKDEKQMIKNNEFNLEYSSDRYKYA